MKRLTFRDKLERQWKVVSMMAAEKLTGRNFELDEDRPSQDTCPHPRGFPVVDGTDLDRVLYWICSYCGKHLTLDPHFARQI